MQSIIILSLKTPFLHPLYNAIVTREVEMEPGTYALTPEPHSIQGATRSPHARTPIPSHRPRCAHARQAAEGDITGNG